MIERLSQLLEEFRTNGSVVGCEPYGYGHINETFLVTTQTGRQYILQRINTHVFPDVAALMENISAVTSFLHAQSSHSREALSIVPTTQNKSYLYHSEDDSHWRMYVFIEDSLCLQAPESPDDFYQSAIAFGTFQHKLIAFPAETLHETIPNFHNTVHRYHVFKETLKRDVCNRAHAVKKEIDFVLQREEDAGILLAQLAQGVLPLRVTHNDAKLNNILLDQTTRSALCVIDLDTVMPGLSLYDFGDSIRFGAATAAEDEPDLDKMELSLDLFERYTEGFLSACPDLTRQELRMLPIGAKLMTLECGLRFLTDYLDGDKYFSIHRERHNLERCRAQFKLVADMEKKSGDMRRIVERKSKLRLDPC